MLGDILDKKYKITALVGEGGMGSVYRGEHLYLRRQYAIKVIRRQHAADPVALKRFRFEAEASSILKHPNIIDIYDFGITDDELAYIVMEFLQGESLDSMLERAGNLQYEVAVPLFMQICDALAHAHSKNVLHRDLKPPNIMLIRSEETGELTVKIVDFGIAKLMSGTGRSLEKLTQPGEVFGSPMYMSPEQCMGKDMDCRADIYSLGCVLYQTLTGKLPFDGDSFVEVVFKHLNEIPPSFAESAPDIAIPEALEDIVMQCLAKGREQRFASVNDLRSSLAQIRPGIQNKKKPTAKTYKEPASASAEELTPDDLDEISRKLDELIMSSMDPILPTRICDVLAAISWLAGEQVLQFSDVLSRIPPDTSPGTLVINDYVARIIHANPGKNVLSDFFSKMAFCIPTLTKENWMVLRASPQEYEEDFADEWRANHPAAIANRLRENLKAMARSMQLKNGKTVHLSEALITQCLENITSFYVYEHSQMEGYTPDLGGMVANWLIAGSTTVPGLGAENPPPEGREAIVVRDEAGPATHASSKKTPINKLNKLPDGTVKIAGAKTKPVGVARDASKFSQKENLSQTQTRYVSQIKNKSIIPGQNQTRVLAQKPEPDQNDNMDEGIQTLLLGIECLEQKYGHHCPQTIEPLNQLFDLYDDCDKYAEALETKKKLLQIISSNSGESLELARCLEDIGVMCLKLKKLLEAEASFSESLKLKIQFLDSQNREVCETRILLANSLLGQDRVAAAEGLVFVAIENIDRSIDRTRKDIADIQYMAADFYNRAKPSQIPDHMEKALSYYEQSYNISKEDLPSKHWDLRHKAMDIARCYSSMHRYITAIEYCHEVIEIDKANLEHARGGKAMADPWTIMAWNYGKLKNYDKAERAYLNSMKIIETEGSPSDLAHLLIEMAKAYDDSGQAKKAKNSRERAAKLAAL